MNDAALLYALEQADRVFEPHHREPEPLCMYCDFSPKGLAESPDMQRFFAVVRAHRSHRLELPVQMIWNAALGHSRGIFHNDLRRLAWFVPPMLAAMVEPTLRADALRILAATGEEITYVALESRPGDPPWFTPAELAALDDFLFELLPFTLQASAWKESVPLLEVSHWFRSDQHRLASRWAALEPASLAEAVLQDYGRPEGLGTEAVRAALEHATLTATDAAVAARCSEAEQLLHSQLHVRP